MGSVSPMVMGTLEGENMPQYCNVPMHECIEPNAGIWVCPSHILDGCISHHKR